MQLDQQQSTARAGSGPRPAPACLPLCGRLRRWTWLSRGGYNRFAAGYRCVQDRNVDANAQRLGARMEAHGPTLMLHPFAQDSILAQFYQAPAHS